MTSSRLPQRTAGAPIGGIKQAFIANDHSGWIKMDGRLVSSLNTAQRAVAATYGWTTRLPDATDAEWVDGVGAFATIAGANTATIAQANLPAVTVTGAYDNQTNTHTHTMAGNNGDVSHPVGGAGFKNDPWPVKAGRQTIGVGQGGAHTHPNLALPLGSGTALLVENKYMSVNAFVYLGT